jgi:hypothetical protein
MLDKKQTSITLICDKCGRYGEKDVAGPFDYGSLHIRGTGRSSPPRLEGVAGRSRNYDLCRLCSNSINRTTKAAKPAALAQWHSV